MGADKASIGSEEIRRRPGRPPLGEKAKDAEVHVRVDERGRKAIDRKRRDGESRAAWIRRAVAFAHAHMPDEWERPGDPVPAFEAPFQAPGRRAEARGSELRTEGFTDAP